MVTDTQRGLRSDPGRPEVCNVCQLHRFFGDDYEEIWDGERTARTGCVDTKKLLVERITAYAGPGNGTRVMANPAGWTDPVPARTASPHGGATMAESASGWASGGEPGPPSGTAPAPVRRRSSPVAPAALPVNLLLARHGGHGDRGHQVADQIFFGFGDVI